MKRLAAYALSVGLFALSLFILVRNGQPRARIPGLGTSSPASTNGGLASKSSLPNRFAHGGGIRQSNGDRIRNPTGINGSSLGTSTLGVAATAEPPRRRAWDTNFLATLGRAAKGNEIRFSLVAGQMALGKIDRLEQRNDQIVYVSGQLSEPEQGRFFFQKQTVPGVAGDFAGVIEFPLSRRAYRIEPDDTGQASDLVERPLESVICVDLPRASGSATNRPQEIPPLAPRDFPSVPVPDYQQGIVVLETLPGSLPVIYLDFQGGYTPSWGGITYERPDFNSSQIRDVWQRVAEDFMPFDINVTTDAEVYRRAPENSRQRIIITPTDAARPAAGGAAYVGSFNWTVETPCWVFETNLPKYCAQACSHEAGHALGLIHDGQRVNGVHSEYYYGHGSGESGWAPTMGVGFYQNVTQWSKGEYLNADNPIDQLAIIASQNNVHYRPDDAGDTLGTSRYLEIYDNNTATAEGLIERSGDMDAYQFTTGGGQISLRADPVNASPNLALRVALYDSSETPLASSSPQDTLGAALRANLPPGTYTFRVVGAGRNDPLTNGFSNYASLGYYSITGSVANARLPTRFVIPENSPTWTVLGVVPSDNPDHNPLTYKISSGNLSNTFAIDDSGVLSVASSALLDYETLARGTQFPVEFELFMDILNQGNPGLTETNRRVLVAITNVNEPPAITGMRMPVLRLPGARFPDAMPDSSSDDTALRQCLGTNCSLTISVPEHSPPGTFVGTLIGSDPDAHTLLSYSIVAGNNGAMFSLDSKSGTITVAGDPVAARQHHYELTVVVSDQTSPTPLLSTARVSITVELPYRTGSISYAEYRNLSGTFVSDLTNDPRFPHDPALEKQMAFFEADTEEDNCGAVMRGYLLPPATGSYTFWIASRDNSELWLSGSTTTADMTRIAHISGSGAGVGPREWTNYPSQQSAPISLAAGYAYYIEARMKAGAGPGHLTVAWECVTNGITRDIIPGDYLAPFLMNYVPHVAGFSAYLHQDAIAGALVGRVSVSDLNRDDLPTLTITAGNEAVFFALDPHSGLIRVASDSLSLATSQTHHILQVRAVDDGMPPLSDTTTVRIEFVPSNAITSESLQQEIWTNIGSNTTVVELTSQAKYPKRPDALRAVSSLSSGSGFGTNYGSRIRAYLTPTNTGAYTFFIASDDKSQLKFSFGTEPATASIIAWVESATGYQEWTRFSAQQSGFVWLVADQRYYVEVLHKQAGGGDHVEVAWAGPGLAGTNLIEASFLSPVDLEYPPELSGATVTLPLNATNGTLVTTLTAIDSALDAVAYRIISGNLSNTFAIEPRTGLLTVANNTFLATYAVTNFSLVIEAQDSGYGGLYPLKSNQATVNVQVVDNTPAVLWTGGGDGGNWSTAGNWSGGVPGDRNKLTFDGYKEQTNYNDLLLEAGLVTINNGGFYIAGNALRLQGGLLSRGDNSWAINSTLDGKQTFMNIFGTLSVAASLNNAGYDLTVLVNNRLRFDGAISGAGGLFKSGAGRLMMTSSNSYTGPTVISAGALALTHSGALARSATIDVQDRAALDGSGLAGSFTIPPGQILKGSGTVIGPVTVNGTLAQGSASAVGFLTFSNRLVLAGHTIVPLSRYVSPQPTRILRVAGELYCGGSLTVTNLYQSTRLGDRFKLFEAERFAGSFASVKLPPLGRGLEWDTSRLAVDGTIQVITPPPQILLVSVTSRSLVIRFPTAAGVNYAIESTLSLQPASAWSLVASRAGSGGTITVLVPLNATEPQCFYRVRTY